MFDCVTKMRGEGTIRFWLGSVVGLVAIFALGLSPLAL